MNLKNFTMSQLIQERICITTDLEECEDYEIQHSDKLLRDLAIVDKEIKTRVESTDKELVLTDSELLGAIVDNLVGLNREALDLIYHTTTVFGD